MLLTCAEIIQPCNDLFQYIFRVKEDIFNAFLIKLTESENLSKSTAFISRRWLRHHKGSVTQTLFAAMESQLSQRGPNAAKRGEFLR